MHLLLLLTKLEMQMPYKVVHMLIQKTLFFSEVYLCQKSLDPSKVLKGETENFSLLMGITIAYSVLSISLINIRQSLMTVSFSL